ncbi:MAG: hypothetical protein E7614_07415 [Ruminococcaceae bacterium]|nr:hypothetical protein [Oscillospiraceae bacterium]
MKKFFVLFLTFSMMLSFASCGNEPNEHESSDDDMSSHVSSDNSFDTSIDTSLEIQSFPKEKVTHDALSDGNYYLKVQTVSGNDVCIREIAAKGADVYSSVREDNEFEWYYSNGRATFVFDDEEKTYEIYSFNSLSIDLFAGEKESEGECVFFDVECSYIKYKLDDKVSLLHIYRKSDGSWVGFQYMYDNEKAEANIVLEASENYPSHAVFSIPDDYEYYFEKGENIASMDWS